MLVLSRRIGEKLVIDNVTFVEVVEVKGDTVKLGFTAPEAVRIYREELLEKEEADDKASA